MSALDDSDQPISDTLRDLMKYGYKTEIVGDAYGNYFGFTDMFCIECDNNIFIL